jgi:hypothetical protein|tara:strand:- start:1120 stop:1305 length:186 start_codon:yes stop_codon:yes gene_type:complete
MDVAVMSRQVQDAWKSWDAAVAGATFKALKVRAPSSSIAAAPSPSPRMLFFSPAPIIRRRR